MQYKGQKTYETFKLQCSKIKILVDYPQYYCYNQIDNDFLKPPTFYRV